MKKKLDEPNKKIGHSKRKRSSLISKQKSIRKKIEGLSKPEKSRQPEEFFNSVELVQAFDRAYRVIELMEEVESM